MKAPANFRLNTRGGLQLEHRVHTFKLKINVGLETYVR